MHITIKLLKTSEKRKILKALGNKRYIVYRGTKITILDFSLESRKQWRNTLNILKEKNVKVKFYIWQEYLLYKGKIKTVYRHVKSEIIHYWQTGRTRNFKGSLSCRRKITSDGNMYLQKRHENFSLFKILKKKNVKIMLRIIYTCE
jgi:hypothetical protein